MQWREKTRTFLADSCRRMIEIFSLLDSFSSIFSSDVITMREIFHNESGRNFSLTSGALSDWKQKLIIILSSIIFMRVSTRKKLPKGSYNFAKSLMHQLFNLKQHSAAVNKARQVPNLSTKKPSSR